MCFTFAGILDQDFCGPMRSNVQNGPQTPVPNWNGKIYLITEILLNNLLYKMEDDEPLRATEGIMNAEFN